MSNQLVTNESSAQRIVLALLLAAFVVVIAVLGIYYFQTSDPYVRNVLALKGDPELGHAIFQMNCAGCHGMKADGRVGPNLHGVSDRKSRASLIHQVISGQTPPMPQFQPTPQEMAHLLNYLESL